jgi:hypothetical protein
VPCVPDSEVIWSLGGMRMSLIRHLHMFASQAACPSGWAALLFLAWAILQGARFACTALNPRLAVQLPQERETISGGVGSGRGGGWGGRSMRCRAEPHPQSLEPPRAWRGGLGEQGRLGEVGGRLVYIGNEGDAGSIESPKYFFGNLLVIFCVLKRKRG